jgi:hypothetical protein
MGEPLAHDPAATRYAFVYGVRRTRDTLGGWQANPWPAVGRWFAGSLVAALTLLAATWAIAGVSGSGGFVVQTIAPPFRVGSWGTVGHILLSNLMVLTLHAMACVAGFIAGSSLPLQAEERTGISRAIHEHGGRFAIIFVVAATTSRCPRSPSCSAARRRPSPRRCTPRRGSCSWCCCPTR